MSTILGADYATRIRNRLGVNDTDLPDAAIDEILPAVEAKIKQRFPDTYTGDDQTFLEAGTVCAIAAELCPYLRTRIPVSERGPHAQFENAQDWEELRKLLQQKSEEYFGKITEIPFVPHFVLGGPSR